jgi:hypothetical protein
MFAIRTIIGVKIAEVQSKRQPPLILTPVILDIPYCYLWTGLIENFTKY